MARVVIEAYQCERCEHVWLPRKKEAPRTCPGCTSPYWDRPREKPRVREKGVVAGVMLMGVGIVVTVMEVFAPGPSQSVDVGVHSVVDVVDDTWDIVSVEASWEETTEDGED